MSDIDFHHDAVAAYPRPLHSVATSLASASTLPTPDAGTSTALARDAVGKIAGQSSRLGVEFDELCGAVLFCLRLYPEGDDRAGLMVELQATQALL